MMQSLYMLNKNFLIIIIIIISVSITLTGCESTSPTNMDHLKWRVWFGEIAPGTLQKVEHLSSDRQVGIRLKARKSKFYTSDGIMDFDFYNNRKKDIYYYHHSNMNLEIQKKDGWYAIARTGTIEPAIILPAKSKNQINLFFQDWNYDFPSGHYRLVYSWHEKWVATEFDLIRDSAISVNRDVIPESLRTAYNITSERQRKDMSIYSVKKQYSQQESHLEFVVQNHGDSQLDYGENNLIFQVYLNGQWYIIPKDLIKSLGYCIPPHSTTTEIASLETWNYNFMPGHYRFGLMFKDGTWIATEFDIVQ